MKDKRHITKEGTYRFKVAKSVTIHSNCKCVCLLVELYNTQSKICHNWKEVEKYWITLGTINILLLLKDRNRQDVDKGIDNWKLSVTDAYRMFSQRQQNMPPSQVLHSLKLLFFSVFMEIDLDVLWSQKLEQTLIRMKKPENYYFILHLKEEENRLQIGEANLSGKKTG